MSVFIREHSGNRSEIGFLIPSLGPKIFKVLLRRKWFLSISA